MAQVPSKFMKNVQMTPVIMKVAGKRSSMTKRLIIVMKDKAVFINTITIVSQFIQEKKSDQILSEAICFCFS